MAAQHGEPVAAVHPQPGAVEPGVAQGHPPGLVERVLAVGGLGLTAYGGDDRERLSGVGRIDLDDAQRLPSAVSARSTDEGRSTAGAGSLDGSTKR